MPITAKYLFIVSMDVEPDKEDLFNEVYDTEHVPDILQVPGVISATRMKLEPISASVGGSMSAWVTPATKSWSAAFAPRPISPNMFRSRCS